MYFEWDPEQNGLAALAQRTVAAVEEVFGESFPEQRINIIIAQESLIEELNRDYRGKDSVTDVLTFPLGLEEEVTGEIYICWQRVISQSREYGHSWQREFAYLLIHGILHLLGYQHGSEPNPEMRAAEEKVLSRLELGRVVGCRPKL